MEPHAALDYLARGRTPRALCGSPAGRSMSPPLARQLAYAHLAAAVGEIGAGLTCPRPGLGDVLAPARRTCTAFVTTNLAALSAGAVVTTVDPLLRTPANFGRQLCQPAQCALGGRQPRPRWPERCRRPGEMAGPMCSPTAGRTPGVPLFPSLPAPCLPRGGSSEAGRRGPCPLRCRRVRSAPRDCRSSSGSTHRNLVGEPAPAPGPVHQVGEDDARARVRRPARRSSLSSACRSQAWPPGPACGRDRRRPAALRPRRVPQLAAEVYLATRAQLCRPHGPRSRGGFTRPTTTTLPELLRAQTPPAPVPLSADWPVPVRNGPGGWSQAGLRRPPRPPGASTWRPTTGRSTRT